jgi:FAS-associated factor 2
LRLIQAAAALKLGITAYPSVLFLSLYARRDGPDALTVITRHSGPPSSITSADTLSEHIVNTVLPRVAPVLNRKRAEQQSREYERRLRQEQDRAYADSERKDYERIVKRRAEEQRQREEQEALKAAAEERERQAKAQAAERQLQISQKMAWRRYARRMLVPQEISGSKTGVRIGIRMPSGKLLVRRFEPTDTVTALYAFVASQFIPAGDAPENDPLEPPGGGGFGTEVEDHDWDWDFHLAVSFPKSVIGWAKGDRTTIGEVAALKGGGNLVVEMQKPEYDDQVKEVEDDSDDDETPSEDSE